MSIAGPMPPGPVSVTSRVPASAARTQLSSDRRPTNPLSSLRSLPRGPGEAPLEHPIIKIGDDGPLDNTAVYEVPEGDYFAMGDNRDNSQDSRVMSAVGFIPAENLVGKAQFLFFSTDGSAAWWEVWKWPFAIRYWRLLHGVG